MTVISDSLLNASGTEWKKENSIEVNSFNDTAEELCIALVEETKLADMRILNNELIETTKPRIVIKI